MRPLIAIILAAAIIFGVQSFISASARIVVKPPELIETQAEGKFSVEVLLSFDAGPDAFAIDPSDAPSVLVEQRGKELLRRTELLPSGSVVKAELDNIVEGANELYLTTTPADNEDPDAIRIARVRILRDDEVIAEKFVASEPGLAVEGAVLLDIPATDVDADEHQH